MIGGMVGKREEGETMQTLRTDLIGDFAVWRFCSTGAFHAGRGREGRLLQFCVFLGWNALKEWRLCEMVDSGFGRVLRVFDGLGASLRT